MEMSADGVAAGVAIIALLFTVMQMRKSDADRRFEVADQVTAWVGVEGDEESAGTLGVVIRNESQRVVSRLDIVMRLEEPRSNSGKEGTPSSASEAKDPVAVRRFDFIPPGTYYTQYLGRGHDWTSPHPLNTGEGRLLFHPVDPESSEEAEPTPIAPAALGKNGRKVAFLRFDLGARTWFREGDDARLHRAWSTPALNWWPRRAPTTWDEDLEATRKLELSPARSRTRKHPEVVSFNERLFAYVGGTTSFENEGAVECEVDNVLNPSLEKVRLKKGHQSVVFHLREGRRAIITLQGSGDGAIASQFFAEPSVDAKSRDSLMSELPAELKKGPRPEKADEEKYFKAILDVVRKYAERA